MLGTLQQSMAKKQRDQGLEGGRVTPSADSAWQHCYYIGSRRIVRFVWGSPGIREDWGTMANSYVED